MLLESWCTEVGMYFLFASAASCSGAVRAAERPPHWEQHCSLCPQHVQALTHTLTAHRASRPEKYIQHYMHALWGTFLIIAWSVIGPNHHSFTLELRQFSCCLYIAAEKIIPSDCLVFLMLFYMGIIWKQSDFSYPPGPLRTWNFTSLLYTRHSCLFPTVIRQ